MLTDSKKVCLIVIDGWGLREDGSDYGDAVKASSHPVVKKLLEEASHTRIYAHGTHVGLPDGLMGNSEVGHLNIGAGRVVSQDIVRINTAVQNHTFLEQECFANAVKYCKSNTNRLHLMGLVSDGGVHAHISHLFEFLRTANEAQIPNCFVHFFADGRDTPPKSSIKYLEMLQAYTKEINYGTISTIMGRYYAMDRDKRWERTKIAYEALIAGVGEVSDNPAATINDRYSKNETDEFLKPIVLSKNGNIRQGDTIVAFNFRSDRMRQLSSVLAGLVTTLDSHPLPEALHLVTMTEYDEKSGIPVIFAKQNMKNVLAEWISAQDLKQMHVAETEKYAHVTFFFNGGREVQFSLEDRILVPSPKVPTYNLKPEMSVHEVGRKVAEAVKRKKYDFVMCNLAPPDMVGHTGDYEATIKAVSATDEAIGIILEACKESGYNLLVTSDHGNAECMKTITGAPVTFHTTNRVFLISSEKLNFSEGGSLCDVAPTILHYMGLPIPSEMTGKSLIS